MNSTISATDEGGTVPVVDPSRGVLRNTGASLAGHAVGLAVPLLTVPYLARVLRPDGWEPVLVAQSLGGWLTLALDFGFELSATRAVARARANPDEIAAVVSGVQSAKLVVLLVTTIVIVCVLLTMNSDLLPSPVLLAWTCAYAAARGLNPFWFFQGLERLREAVLVETVAKVLAAVAVFFVVLAPEHAWRVLALQAVFAVLSMGILTARMGAALALPTLSLRGAKRALRESAGIFTLRASSGLYNQANAFVLSNLVAPPTVAFFGGAERVVRAAVNLLQPITQALFPRQSYLSATAPAVAQRSVVRYLVVIGGAGVLGGCAILFGAPLLVRVLLGPGYEASVSVLRVLAPLPVLTGVGTVLGFYWAIPFGHERAFVRVVVGAGFANLLFALLLAPRFGALGMATAVVATEALVATALAAYYVRCIRRDRARAQR